MTVCYWQLVSRISVLLHLTPKEEFSHFSLAAMEAREMFTVFVYLYLFHYYGGGGGLLLELVFLFTRVIELCFYFCHMTVLGTCYKYIHTFSFGVDIVLL